MAFALVHRGEPLRRQPAVRADAAVLARQRHRRPVPRASRATPRSSWPWPSCSRSSSCCSPSSATARSAAACRRCGTRRRPASRSASTSPPPSSRRSPSSAGIAGLGGALLAMWKSSSVGVSDFGAAAGPAPRSRARAGRGGQRHHHRVRPDLRRVRLRDDAADRQLVPGAAATPMNLLPGLAGIGLGQNPDGIVGQVAEAIEERGERARGEPATSPERRAVVPERVGRRRAAHRRGDRACSTT